MSEGKNSYEDITITIKDHIAYVTLNRPNKRNALSQNMMAELLHSMDAIAKKRDIQVVVLRAEGEAFSAGHDLNEMLDQKSQFYQTLFDTCTRLMERIQAIPQPVIAQVQGVATAAGCQLATSCDLIVASSKATFSTPGVKIGLFCTTPMVALTRTLPAKKAMELLLTGESMDAETAHHYGMVNYVVSPEDLEEKTKKLAEKIQETSPGIIAIGKETFYRQLQMPQSQAYGYAKEVMALNATLPDAREGIKAFLEKRKPQWSHKDSS